MKTKYSILVGAVLIAMLLNGCKKFLDVDVPKTQLVSSAVFTDDKTANSAVAGMYSYMYQLNSTLSSFAGWHTTIYADISADGLTRPSFPSDPFLINVIPTDESNIATFWQGCYNTIYQANSILEGLAASTSMSTAARNQFRGEALFVRAYSYFYLVNYFGDVPLITTTDVTANGNAGRTSKSLIYDQIKVDLLEAHDLVADNYTTYFSGERVRANKWVIKALLARTYLYTGQWDKAEEYASAIISNTTLFALQTDLNTVFLKNSREAIWQFLSFAGAGYTIQGQLLIPANNTTVPTYAITSDLYASFEAGDKRKAGWIGSSVSGGSTYYYAFKYKNRNATLANTGEYDMALRLAEQYLIRAEARAQQGNLGTATTGAIGDTNIIRARAGLSNTGATDKAAVLLAIEKENRNEFFAEWGHRWLDLKRTGRIDAVLSPKKSTWKSTAALYPIPEIERSKTPALTQNPGY